jgi:hypothetical protein
LFIVVLRGKKCMKKVFWAALAALAVAACEQMAGPAVEPPPAFVRVTGIEGAPSEGKKGAVLNLGVARVAPENATRRDIAWELLDGGGTGVTKEALAEGRPIPSAVGELKLRAVVAGGLGESRDYTRDISVLILDDGFVAVSGIAGVPPGGLKGLELNLNAARVRPENATQQFIEWIFLDGGSTGLGEDDLAGGKLIPPAAGELKLLAVVAGGLGEGAPYTQEITIVIVNDPGAVPHSVNIDSPINGNIAAYPAGAAAGRTITLTIAPDPGYGLKAGSLRVNNGAVAVNASAGAYSFVMPGEDAVVAAEFEALPEGIYTVGLGGIRNGSISAYPAGAAAGTTIALTIRPNQGYTLKTESLRVNRGAVELSGSGSAYTFVMPAGNVTVSAEFEAALLYNVSIGHTAHGSVAAEPGSAAAGALVVLTVTPDLGYRLKPGSLKVNNMGVNLGASDSVYAFVMPAGNAAVSAEFEEDPSRIFTRLEIASPPDPLIYMPGAEVKPAGLVVQGGYGDGGREELAPSAYRIDMSKVTGTGTQRVFIRKDGLESLAILIYIDPTGRALKSAVLTTPPSSAQEMGKDFNTAGMVITGTYADGSTEALNNGLCKIRGYDKWKRGTQRVALSINGIALASDLELNLKIPASAIIKMVETQSSGRIISLGEYHPGDADIYRPVYIKGMPFDLAQANLRPVVTVNGVLVMLSWGDGLGPGDTVTGYNATVPGKQTLSLNLDGKTGTFNVFVLDAEPRVYFDYGYMRHAGDPGGAGPGEGKHYARPNETLILAPIRFLIGYDAENRDIGASYSWSVTGGSYDTAAGTSGDSFAFTPKAAGTYTVTVAVTGRNFVTGQTDTKTASTEVVCYTGALPAGTFVSPLKNFSPGQFTEGGTGHGWSLGAALGYEVFRIEPSSDFRVTGNGFGGWEEPGIVWVQEDRNGNDLPDEMWYELTGSDETNPLTKPYITRRYAIKWFRFENETEENQFGQIIRTTCWVDNKGRAGVLSGGWPKDWGVSGDWVAYTGTVVRDGQGSVLGPGIEFPQGLAGYVDCYYNNDQNYVFSKDTAIRADGSPANLDHIRFVKVQTGYFNYGGILGEYSTEIVSATGLGDQSGGFPNPLGSVSNK